MIILPYRQILFIFIIIFLNLLFFSKAYAQSFLTLSDIHFDPLIDCQKNCVLMSQLLEKNSEKKWQDILSNFHQMPSSAGRDTNYALLKNVLNQAKNIASTNKIKFVIVLGDVLGHDFKKHYYRYAKNPNPSQYQLYVNKTLRFLNLVLMEAFLNTDIYSLIGNNDAYRGDYFSIPSGDFFNHTGIIWSQLIKDPANRLSMQKQFKEAGYYALTVPNEPRIRLILLNTVLFSNKARGHHIDTAAKKELGWLKQELNQAHLKKQTVLLAMHIPPTFDVNISDRIHLFTLLKLWHIEYKMQFQEILQSSPPVITAIFAGHLHQDGLTQLSFGKEDVLILQTTSVSPFFGNHPGFKLYHYDVQAQSVKLIDYTSYFLNHAGKRYEQHAPIPLSYGY